MSSRTVPRFAPAMLLAAALAAPAVAQETRPQAPLPREQNSETVFRQDRRDDVLVLLPMTPPEAPAPTMCPPQAPVIAPAPSGCCAASPFACEGRAPRVPQPTAFVIGVGGLHRVMPMPEPPRFLVAPTPVPTGSFAINGDAGCCGSAPIAGPVILKRTQTGHLAIGLPEAPPPVTGCVPPCVVQVAYEVCPPCPMPIVPANPLNGTWYRDLGAALVAATFAGDELTLRVTQRDGDTAFTVTFTAHCTVTKDGLVYGAITSADVGIKDGDAKGMELAEMSLSLQELIDGPFSFRAKATSAGLMVSQLKFASTEGIRARELAIFGGLFKQAKDGKVPELKPIKTSGPVGRCDAGSAAGAAVGAAIGHCPSGAAAGALIGVPADSFERIGIDFNAPPLCQPVAPSATLTPPLKNAGPPIPVAPPCSSQPVRPASSSSPAPDAMKQMAQDAFQEMFRAKDKTLPSSPYLEHYPQYFIPNPAFPLPRELASQEGPEGVTRRGGCCANAAKPGVVTWVRELGSKRCVIKLAPDHFTAIISEAHETDGKTTTGHLTFTVDYHLTRDGMTAVGLVTSVDATCESDFANGEAEGIEQWLGEVRRALEDKPIALTFRTYGDALVIGNVRMPTVGCLFEGEPSTYIGGRYRTMGDKPLPALKAVKSEPRPLPTYGPALAGPPGGLGYGPPVPCPIAYPPGCGFPAPLPGAYGPAPGLPPLAYPPAPAYPAGTPTGDLLPPQNLSQPTRPAPAPIPSVSLPPLPTIDAGTPVPTVQAVEAVTIPEPRPTMAPPTAPVPTMPEPVAPVVETGLKLKVGCQPFLTAPLKPSKGIEQLLRDSEDLRKIWNEWQRFWFDDQTPRLKPERIHGGIY